MRSESLARSLIGSWRRGARRDAWIIDGSIVATGVVEIVVVHVVAIG